MSMTALATSASGPSSSKQGPKRHRPSTGSSVSQEQEQAGSKRQQLDQKGLEALEGQPAARAVAAGAAAAADTAGAAAAGATPTGAEGMPLPSAPAPGGRGTAGGPTPEEQMKALLDSSTPGTRARMLGVLVSAAKGRLLLAM